MAQKYVNNKYILLIDDIQFHLHKRSCYIDQLQKLCEIEFQYDQYQSIPREYPLFDCLIVVGLQKSAGSFKPFIKMKYPNSVLLDIYTCYCDFLRNTKNPHCLLLNMNCIVVVDTRTGNSPIL